MAKLLQFRASSLPIMTIVNLDNAIFVRNFTNVGDDCTSAHPVKNLTVEFFTVNEGIGVPKITINLLAYNSLNKFFNEIYESEIKHKRPVRRYMEAIVMAFVEALMREITSTWTSSKTNDLLDFTDGFVQYVIELVDIKKVFKSVASQPTE